MFLASGLYLNRGTYNAFAGGPDNGSEALNVVTHFYKSKTDTLATIVSPGYFPSSLGSASDLIGFISVNDMFFIEGSDTSSQFQVQSINPFTLVSDSIIPAFMELVIPVNWIGPWASSVPDEIVLQRFNDVVYFYMRGIAANPAVNSSTINSPGSIIPIGFRPDVFGPYFPMIVLDNTIRVMGSAVIQTDGSVIIFNGLTSGNFTASGLAGTFALSATWSTTDPF